MPREVNPLDDEELYRSIQLGGVRSPGTVKLSGHDLVINWDVKGATGQQGASSTLKDIPLRTFKATFYLATVEQFDQWRSFRDLIKTTVQGRNVKPLDVYHPDLATNGIGSVVLAKFGGVIHDDKGGQTITVDFQEYAPPKKKPVGDPNDPNAAAKKELAELTETFKKTPWG